MLYGQSLQAAGDLDGAMAAYEKAAALLPRAGGRGNPNALIARLALQQKDNDRAMRAFEAVLRMDPSDVDAARQLASLWRCRATTPPRKPRSRASSASIRSTRVRRPSSAGSP